MTNGCKDGATRARFFGAISALVFVIAGVILLILLISPKETYISDGDKMESIGILDCRASSVDEAFFNYDTASRADHEIKITFKSGVADKINYTYEGEFSSNDAAEIALSWMHADYNNYMGEVGVYQEDLSPMFSVINAKGIINLYIDESKFTSATARFVFLDEDKYAVFRDMRAEEIGKLYESKGFSCEFSE